MKSLLKLLKKRNEILEDLSRIDFEMEGNFLYSLFDEKAFYVTKLEKVQKKIKAEIIHELEKLK
jgi:hypothetical protein